MKRRFTFAAAAVVLSACLVVGVDAMAQDNGKSRPVVRVDSGDLKGTTSQGVDRFKAIPFAAPPVDELRWQPPQPVEPWKGMRNASKAGPACMQADAPDMPPGTPRSEDCLTLEVTAPAGDTKDLPVMVWVPGGGFVTGAGSIYDPTRLVKSGDMVVVTVNYRLGVFGFFGHPELGESNFGLQDQVAALRWVNENIEAFGGDPDRVTLAGASAGAMSACTLMTSPEAEKLFQQAIVQSGSCLSEHPAGAFGEGVGAISSWKPLETIQSTGAFLAEQMECADFECLRRKGSDDLLPFTGMFPLVAYDTELVPENPATVFREGREADIPLLQGNTDDEHSEFALAVYPDGVTADQYPSMLRAAFGEKSDEVADAYPLDAFVNPTAAISQVFSDRGWICPSLESSRSHSALAATYAYVFDDPSAPTPSGEPVPEVLRPATVHGSDMYYLFDFPGDVKLTPKQRVLADQMAGYWSRFVATGDPNSEAVIAWPPTEPDDPAVLGLAADGVAPFDAVAQHNCSLLSTE